MHNITDSYLRAIFSGSYLTGKVSNKQLAGLLGVTPATTTEYVKKLQAQGLVLNSRYGSISLSRRGIEQAVKVIKKLRLCEVWLNQQFDLPLEEISRQAWLVANFDCKLMTEQLNTQLKFPVQTPFGGNVQKPQLIVPERQSLSRLVPGVTFKICEYLDDPRIIQYVVELNLAVGQQGRLKRVDDNFSLVNIQIDNKNMIVNQEVAHYIYVEII